MFKSQALGADTKEQVYRCGIPLPMLHRHYSATPKVKMNMGQIKKTMSTQYEKPKPVGLITIAAMTGEYIQERDLTAISPEEDRIAYVLRIAERIEDGADDNELMQWRKYLMCAPAEFMIVDSAKRRFFLAIQQRRTIVKQGVSAKRSGLQVCQEIVSAWDSEGDHKLTAAKLQVV